MSLIATSQEIKQQKLILVLIVIILAIVIIVYFGFFRSAPIISVEGPTSATTSIRNIDTIGEDIHFLKNPRFQDLKKYGAWPIETGKTGRENPFYPFNKSTPTVETASEKTIKESSTESTSTIENLTVEDLMNLLEEETKTDAQ